MMTAIQQNKSLLEEACLKTSVDRNASVKSSFGMIHLRDSSTNAHIRKGGRKLSRISPEKREDVSLIASIFTSYKSQPAAVPRDSTVLFC
ncbi:unnamed protein product [Protopolystoma xenopodis]|uniref:Uncharacterized protein n=1 Tax=Protopolystoma xenopodis TaxID=117903 RepID=A0A3S5CEU2_9PLAT|nr:unnamed protein product [Protopolystoma xenopodis]